MNTEERRTLHGLYFGRGQIVGEAIKHRPEEIIWLLNTEIPRTASWRQDNGGYQIIESDKSGDYLVDLTKGRNRVRPPLSFLSECGYILWDRSDDYFAISITSKGAELARALNTRFGRINLWYKSNKDGILGVVLVALIAIATSLITNFLTQSRSKAELQDCGQNSSQTRPITN
jgi:hypothetical protein